MSEIPADIFQTACGIVMEAKSLKSVLRHKDVADAIAVALVAERNRCAAIVDDYAIKFDTRANETVVPDRVHRSMLMSSDALKLAASGIREGDAV